MAPEPPEYLAPLGLQALDTQVGVYLIDPPLAPSPGDTNPTFVHWCERPGFHIETGEPLFPRYVLTGTGDHTVHSREPWHLEASLLCPDCGLHGWIREGHWQGC